MLTERQLRITSLARTNKAFRESPEFLSGLSFALEREIGADSLLQIDQSDRVRELCSDGYRHARETAEHCFRTIQSKIGLEEIVTNINRLCEASGDESVVLLLTTSDFGVLLTLREILRRIWNVLRFDENTVTLSSSDGVCGLTLDWNPDDPKETFELAIWGARWSEALA